MSRLQLLEAALTGSVIGAFYEVYNTLGFGFLEHLYVQALERELRARGHRVGREVAVTVFYKGDPLGHHRLDMVVDERLVVEVKSTVVLPGIAGRQLYNYLRSTQLKVGLLLHFGPKPTFHRLVNIDSPESRSV
jgi:GxxExxY protein